MARDLLNAERPAVAVAAVDRTGIA